MVDVPSPPYGAASSPAPQHTNLIIKNTVYAVEEAPWVQVTRRPQSSSPRLQVRNLSGKPPLCSDPGKVITDALRRCNGHDESELSSDPEHIMVDATTYPDTDEDQEEMAYVPAGDFLRPPGDWWPVAVVPATMPSTAVRRGKAKPKAKHKASGTKCETRAAGVKPLAKAELAACKPTGTFPIADTLPSNMEVVYAEELIWSTVKETVGSKELEKKWGSVKVRGLMYEVTLAKAARHCAVVFVPCEDADAASVAKELIGGTEAKDPEGSRDWWLKTFQRRNVQVCVRGRGAMRDINGDRDTFMEDRREQNPLAMLVFGGEAKLADAVPQVIRRVQSVCAGLKAIVSS